MNDNQAQNAPGPPDAKKAHNAASSEAHRSTPSAHREQSDQRTDAKHRPTIVGIGASAGGLSALKSFFSHVPAGTNLAFVVVVHLSPQHESHLSDLLQSHVKMPVEQVTDTVSIEANHVYVIPPNANLSAVDTHLRLTQLEEERRQRAPIDHFFRTLAATHDGDAVGVILTGTGSDGTLGIKDVKAKGGLIIVQEPNEAEFDGMPQSAIATGLVDWILPLAEIPAAIIRYDETTPKVSVSKHDHDENFESVEEDEQSYLQKIFTQLRARTDRDFSRYKQSTILRRIARRMQLNYIDNLPAYIEKLRSDSDEVKALADDCLITVTNFFRDPEVFERLEREVIPRLFRNKGAKDTIRAWSVGCATGEEAYSLAMLMAEESARHESPPRIQIFASDLHKRSLERGREGLYSGDIQTDVPQARLKRFFQKENGGYRVQKEIRDMVVFSPHNLLGDPPFSRIDLISCRNLLIYLQRHAQRDVVELFHYSLNPEGILVLGTAEILDPSDLFRVEDKRLCFYRKRNVPVPEPRLPVFPMLTPRQHNRAAAIVVTSNEPPAYGAMHQKMLELYAPPSILVGPDDKVVHLSENAGRYLVPPGGEVTTVAYKLVREELRLELRTALQAARQNRTATDSKPIFVQFNGHSRPVVMHVRPSQHTHEEGFTLVIFEEREWDSAGTEPANAGLGPVTDTEIDRIRELERELAVQRQRTQALVEEYETSREEMQASAEEMQSTNEELRSTMEELETSKEELQSINEELQTVNQENRHKVEELAQLSSDLQNLLTATEIATLFLDRELRILRFTPKLAELFNIRVQDRGRPISDLTHRLGSTDLRADAEEVLSRLIPVEREVKDEAGHWFLTRVLPYRSSEDRILGVVITFVDITARKNAEETLRVSEERLRRITSVDVVGVLIFNNAGTLIDSNEAFRQMSGYTREEIASKMITWRTMTPPEYVADSEEQMASFQRTGRLGPYEKEYLKKDGTRYWLLFAGASLGDGTFVEYCIDVTSRKQVEAELQTSKHYAETIIETLHEPLLVLTPELSVRSANLAFYRHFDVIPEDTIGRTVYELGNRQWNIPELRTLLEEVLPQRKVFEDFEVVHTFESIGKRVMLLNARQLEDLQLILLGIR
ncbi:MAG TPA: chemotaxis protein CheB, partial [Bryobacteraceae bacterium]|nr:chemotaxis protein CheB [Bryobacteraceae bacterium]